MHQRYHQLQREDAENTDFDGRNGALTSLQLHVGRISALMNPLTYAVINLAVIALVQTGAVQVNEGILTQGQVVALYNYMSQILVELIKLANLIITINKSLACAGRICILTLSMAFQICFLDVLSV